MSERSACTVWPWASALGWLTSGVSAIVTVNEPCVTAAGETRTPAFLTLNPNGKVPLLQLADGTCFSVGDVRDSTSRTSAA